MSFLKSYNAVDALKKKSAGIVDIFTRTVQQLAAVNEEINAVAEQKTEEKARLEMEVTQLLSQKQDNDRVIEKINKIFEP